MKPTVSAVVLTALLLLLTHCVNSASVKSADPESAVSDAVDAVTPETLINDEPQDEATVSPTLEEVTEPSGHEGDYIDETEGIDDEGSGDDQHSLDHGREDEHAEEEGGEEEGVNKRRRGGASTRRTLSALMRKRAQQERETSRKTAAERAQSYYKRHGIHVLTEPKEEVKPGRKRYKQRNKVPSSYKPSDQDEALESSSTTARPRYKMRIKHRQNNTDKRRKPQEQPEEQEQEITQHELPEQPPSDVQVKIETASHEPEVEQAAPSTSAPERSSERPRPYFTRPSTTAPAVEEDKPSRHRYGVPQRRFPPIFRPTKPRRPIFSSKPQMDKEKVQEETTDQASNTEVDAGIVSAVVQPVDDTANDSRITFYINPSTDPLTTSAHINVSKDGLVEYNSHLQYIEDHPDEKFRFEDSIISQITKNHTAPTVFNFVNNDRKKEDSYSFTTEATQKETQTTVATTNTDDVSIRTTVQDEEKTNTVTDFSTQFTDANTYGNNNVTDSIATDTTFTATEANTVPNQFEETEILTTNDAQTDTMNMRTTADDSNIRDTETTIVGSEVISVTTSPIVYSDLENAESDAYSPNLADKFENLYQNNLQASFKSENELSDLDILSNLRQVISIAKSSTEVPTSGNENYDYYEYYEDCDYYTIDENGNYDYHDCVNITLNHTMNDADYATTETIDVIRLDNVTDKEISETVDMSEGVAILTDGFYYPEPNQIPADTISTTTSEKPHVHTPQLPPKKLIPEHDVRVSTGFLVKDAPKKSQTLFGPHDVEGNQVRTDRQNSLDNEDNQDLQEIFVESNDPESPPVKLIVNPNAIPVQSDSIDINVSSSMFAGNSRPSVVGEVLPVELERNVQEGAREGNHVQKIEKSKTEDNVNESDKNTNSSTGVGIVIPVDLDEDLRNNLPVDNLTTNAPTTTTESTSFLASLFNIFAGAQRPRRPPRPTRRPVASSDTEENSETPQFKTEEDLTISRPSRPPFRPRPSLHNRFRPPFDTQTSDRDAELKVPQRHGILERFKNDPPPSRFHPQHTESLNQNIPPRQNKPDPTFGFQPFGTLQAPPPLLGDILPPPPFKEKENDTVVETIVTERIQEDIPQYDGQILDEHSHADTEISSEDTNLKTEENNHLNPLSSTLPPTKMGLEKDYTNINSPSSTPLPVEKISLVEEHGNFNTPSSTLPPVMKISLPIDEFIDHVSNLPEEEVPPAIKIQNVHTVPELDFVDVVDVTRTITERILEEDKLQTTPASVVLEDDFSSDGVAIDETIDNAEIQSTPSPHENETAESSNIPEDYEEYELYEYIDENPTTININAASSETTPRTTSPTTESSTTQASHQTPEYMPEVSEYIDPKIQTEGKVEPTGDVQEEFVTNNVISPSQAPFLTPEEVDEKVNLFNEIVAEDPLQHKVNQENKQEHLHQSIPERVRDGLPHDGHHPTNADKIEEKPHVLSEPRPSPPFHLRPPFRRPVFPLGEERFKPKPPRVGVTSNIVGIDSERVPPQILPGNAQYSTVDLELPPSLPNLQIIPFVPADAVTSLKEESGVSEDSMPIKLVQGEPIPGQHELCWNNGQVLGNGIPVNYTRDSCQSCRCYFGQLICQQKVCQEVPKHCSGVMQPNECCPMLVCKPAIDEDEELPPTIDDEIVAYEMADYGHSPSFSQIDRNFREEASPNSIPGSNTQSDDLTEDPKPNSTVEAGPTLSDSILPPRPFDNVRPPQFTPPSENENRRKPINKPTDDSEEIRTRVPPRRVVSPGGSRKDVPLFPPRRATRPTFSAPRITPPFKATTARPSVTQTTTSTKKVSAKQPFPFDLSSIFDASDFGESGPKIFLPRPIQSSASIDPEEIENILFTEPKVDTTPKPVVQPAKPILPEIPEAVRSQLPLGIDPILGSGIFQLSGCNIYGREYEVGESIKELSATCKACRCTQVGVQCLPIC